jgi:hypothetical protein
MNDWFFYQVEAAKIQERSVLYPQMDMSPTIFKPCVDDFSRNPFMPEDPWDLVSIIPKISKIGLQISEIKNIRSLHI